MSMSILDLNQGAKFYRADLHIHSFGASHDVTDQTMMPAAIVASAQAAGLSLIAITDHNDISNVKDALSAGDAAGLFVIPGVELSTAGGHLLAYLPTLVLLEKFMAQVSIAGAGSSTSRCQTGLLDCLSLLGKLGGFGILAHVDAPGGFGEAHPTMTPHALDVLCHPALLGIELRNGQSETRYAEGDPDPGRAAAGKERIQRLKLGAKQHLARVLFSDAHSLSALGRNAKGDKKVTRVKMAAPSFEPGSCRGE